MQKTKLNQTVLLGSLVFLLSACGGDSVSSSELKKAINSTAQNQRVCLPYQLNVEHRLPDEKAEFSQFGATEIRLLKRQADGSRANTQAIKQMDNLVKAGLYKRGKEEKSQSVRYETYHLTERASDYIRSGYHGNVLCMGTRYAEKINYYTEPTAYNGLTMMKVSYQASVKPEKWARALFEKEESRQIFNQEKETSITLVKTNEGWRDIRTLR